MKKEIKDIYILSKILSNNFENVKVSKNVDNKAILLPLKDATFKRISFVELKDFFSSNDINIK